MSNSVLLVGVVISAGCSPASPVASEACRIVTPAEVSQATGVRVVDAKPGGTGDGCTFVGEPPDSVTTVDLVDDDSAGAFAEAKWNSAASGGTVRDLPGTGDEAFVFSGHDGDVHAAEARAGTRRIRVLVRGPGASANAATTILVQAVERRAGP